MYSFSWAIRYRNIRSWKSNISSLLFSRKYNERSLISHHKPKDYWYVMETFKKVYDIESWILKKNIICIMILASIMRHIIYSSYIIIQCVFLISLNAPFEKRIIILFHKKVWKRNLIYSIMLDYIWINKKCRSICKPFAIHHM